MKDRDRFDTSFFIPLAGKGCVMKSRRGVEIAVDSETARLDVIRPDVLKLSISRGGEFDNAPTHAVLSDEFGIIPFKFEETVDGISISTDCLNATVTFDPFSLEVRRADGSIVVSTAPDRAFLTLNDRWAVTKEKESGDIFLGFGQKTGPLDKSGRRMTMWNTDIILEAGEPDAFAVDYDPYYISIPFYYQLREGQAAGFFIDNGYRMQFDLTCNDSYSVIGEGGCFTEYIFAGPSMHDILARYSELTGRMKAPPLWALGHHQCRWYDYDADDVRALAGEYRERNIPCDSLWLDIDYMDGFRVFSWDRKKFPDPAALVRELMEDGFKTVTIIDPGIKKDEKYDVYREGVERHHFAKTKCGTVFAGKVWPGHTVFPDFTREETRAWWAELIRRHALIGLAGIWIDMNEPAVGEADIASMRFDREGSDDDHGRWHNQYALLMAESTDDGLRRAQRGQRRFVLSRSGFAGIQRSAANWMGDNVSRWDHLAMSLPMCSGMGISGQPFTGCDIGGFAGDTDAELLVRWYQAAVFMPFFRNHNIKDSIDQYPWSFGEESESLIREAITLRYRYLPYLYTAFMLSAETGEPIQRPLTYDFQDDPLASAVGDQFMCGRDLLVAPVTAKGAVSRAVYLPAGLWYRLESHECIKGGDTIDIEADISSLPVFVRAGAVIPGAGPVMSTADYSPAEISLDVYLPDKDGAWDSILHEDDGASERYLSGEYYRTTLTVTARDGRFSLAGTTTGSGYMQFPRRSFRIRTFGARKVEKTIGNTGESFSVDLAP